MKKPALTPYFSFDRKGSEPYYRQVYEGYRDAIVSGRLRSGQRLPSTRALAAELGISRLPLINAYEQLLHEGYVAGKVGSGTYVMDTIPDEFTQPGAFRLQQARSAGRALAALSPAQVFWEPGQRGLAPFRVSLPALDQFPHAIWSRLVSRHAKSLPMAQMAYGDPAGYPRLRESIAEYLRTARAVRCSAEQIVIVSGSQMALQLCARALLKSTDAVCLEDPGYPGARDALGATGASVVPVPVDDEGIEVARIAAPGRNVRAVYVTPSHQYPLGISMSASRRLALLECARRNHFWIIEDDYDSEYRYASRPLPSLQGMGSSAPVIYIGTFSKVLFPSLRIGYLVVPAEMTRYFAQLREQLDVFSPTLYQLALADFIEEGHFVQHLRRMRNVYRGRLQALIEGLQRGLGGLLRPYNVDAGLHVAAFAPSELDDRELVGRAAEAGINCSALSTCYAGRRKRSGLILGFGGSDERRIQSASRILARVVRALIDEPLRTYD